MISPTRAVLLGLQVLGWSLLKVLAVSHTPLLPQLVCDPCDAQSEPTAVPARGAQTPATSCHHAGRQASKPSHLAV